MLFLLGALCTAAHAEERGSIGGIVQREGQGIAEHRIMLIRFGANREVQRVPGETDAQGQFLFDNLETGQAFEYVVGIRYAGQLYRSEAVRLEGGQHRAGIVVDVGESSAQAVEEEEAQPRLHIANHLMVMVLRDEHLEVREVMRIINNGSKSYTGKMAQQGLKGFSLHLPLPQGYYNLADIQGLATEHIRSHASGLSYDAPLPPGEHRVMFTYALPLRNDVTTILAERSLATASLDVLVQDEHLVAASDLQFNGRVSIEPHTFFHFRGTGLTARSRSWLQLTRRTESASLLRVGAYGLIIGIALLGVGFPLYEVWHGQGSQTARVGYMTPEEMQALQAARLRLLRLVARLDDQRGAGTIEESMYQQHRRGYKKELFALSEQLRQAQQYKEAIG